MKRRRALVMLAASALCGGSVLNASPVEDSKQQSDWDHLSWVSDVLQEMLTIRPGMTRLNLLSLFTTEGGIATRYRRTYVNRRCQLFKVEVVFKPVDDSSAGGQPDWIAEDDNDVILKISRPYLEFEVKD